MNAGTHDTERPEGSLVPPLVLGGLQCLAKQSYNTRDQLSAEPLARPGGTSHGQPATVTRETSRRSFSSAD